MPQPLPPSERFVTTSSELAEKLLEALGLPRKGIKSLVINFDADVGLALVTVKMFAYEDSVEKIVAAIEEKHYRLVENE